MCDVRKHAPITRTGSVSRHGAGSGQFDPLSRASGPGRVYPRRVHRAGKHISRRQALGLPDPAVIRDPARLARVRSLIASAQDSAVLAGLVHLAGDVANADSAQLSLLADVQHATVIQCCEPAPWQQTSDVDDSLCTVTVLSSDVLVAADTPGAYGAQQREPMLLLCKPLGSGHRWASTSRGPAALHGGPQRRTATRRDRACAPCRTCAQRPLR